jgi:hypothetical protein
MSHLSELTKCFNQDFEDWLLNSNCPDIGPYKGEWWIESSKMRQSFSYIKVKSLEEIFNILLKDPEADYFWYGYPRSGPGKLTYSLPHHPVVPGGSLTVDKEKIKGFLRDIKLDTILS